MTAVHGEAHPDAKVRVDYFSDMLCVWAYAAQIRLDELRQHYGARISVQYHFLSLFGDTRQRIGEAWRERGGFAGYGRHVAEVGRDFPHIQIHPAVWSDADGADAVPASSVAVHLFLKAVQLLERQGVVPAQADEAFGGRSLFEEMTWRLRRAFFVERANIACRAVQFALAREMGVPVDGLTRVLDNGEAMAAQCRDLALAEQHRVEGSPTFLLNEGRQKLYGNVGYRIIEANVEEILVRPGGQASWC